MAEEVHSYEVVFLFELLEIATERVNLTGSARDEILLLAIDSLEAVNRIALDVLRTDGLYQFLNSRCDIMLRPVRLCIIPHTAYLIFLSNERASDFEAHATAAALPAHCLILAPCSITLDASVL